MIRLRVYTNCLTDPFEAVSPQHPLFPRGCFCLTGRQKRAAVAQLSLSIAALAVVQFLWPASHAALLYGLGVAVGMMALEVYLLANPAYRVQLAGGDAIRAPPEFRPPCFFRRPSGRTAKWVGASHHTSCLYPSGLGRCQRSLWHVKSRVDAPLGSI